METVFHASYGSKAHARGRHTVRIPGRRRVRWHARCSSCQWRTHMKPIRAVFTAAMTAALTVCEARAGSGPPNDVWLASKAKVSLLTTEGLGVKDVHVA